LVSSRFYVQQESTLSRNLHNDPKVKPVFR
jgi:hypothetical protein